MDASNFAEQLRRYRVAAGLTQEELAERAHLSKRGIADLERGQRQAPRKATVALLAEALGLATDERARLEAVIRRHRTPLPRPSNDLPAPLLPTQEPQRALPASTQALGVRDTSTVPSYRCSFCGKRPNQVVLLIAGTGSALICDECVELADEQVQQHKRRAHGVRE
jgi:transcriptional regulator with XRE-family HTH domain